MKCIHQRTSLLHLSGLLHPSCLMWINQPFGLKPTAIRLYGIDPVPIDICAELYDIWHHVLSLRIFFILCALVKLLVLVRENAIKILKKFQKRGWIRGSPAPTMDAPDRWTVTVPPLSFVLWFGLGPSNKSRGPNVKK